MQLIPNMSPKLTAEPYISCHELLCIFDYMGRNCKFHKYYGLTMDDHVTWTKWFSSGEAERYFEMMNQRII